MTNEMKDIYKYLNNTDIKHSNAGYRYLLDAICMMVEDPIENAKISVVYGKLAKKNGTSSICVERAIRYTILSLNLSNKEFIVRASHEILYCNEVTA
jgi:hypothetical protein